MENYKLAAKQKERFATARGVLSVEQLFDLSPEELDTLAVGLQEEYDGSKGKSFLTKRTTKDKNIKMRLDLVLDILQTKLDEANEEKNAAEVKRHNSKIEQMIAAKEDEELSSMSVADLRKLLK